MEVLGVIKKMKEFECIRLFRTGMNFSQIAKELDINRKTVRRIVRRHEQLTNELLTSPHRESVEAITEKIVLERKYDTSNRKARAFTPEVNQRMQELLRQEEIKSQKLGSHKQYLTAKQVHELLLEEGFSISYRTTAHYWANLKKKSPESFIRQEYNLGERVEFDFGEVKLEINGVVQTYHLAVFAAPASDYFWAYLYTNQKRGVFQEAHVRFFEQLGGSYHEVVYDNMRNVVSRFIGRHEKQLNESLVQLSLYYGFNVNVTNCFSGNEKGTVEGRVKKVRQACFAKKYQFDSLKEAREYLHQQLIDLNQNSRIEQEKQHLLPYRPPFEIAQMAQLKVNKYAMIQWQKKYYSVPDYLVGHTIQIKVYEDFFIVFANHKEVCRHQKIEDNQQYQLVIEHYLNTFKKKPGAIEHSLVLKQNPDLNYLYRQYYKENPRKFIEDLQLNIHLPHDQLIERMRMKGQKVSNKTPEKAAQSLGVLEATYEGLTALNRLYGLEESPC